jgi:hypothetical protein
MNLIQASVRNVGTHGLMLRENTKRKNRKVKSTDAVMGADRIVVAKNKEAPVMGVERRIRGRSVFKMSQL